MGIHFDWDEAKRGWNISKHGIEFYKFALERTAHWTLGEGRKRSNSAIEGGCEDRMDSSLFWGRLGLPIVAVTLGANEAVDSSG